MEDLPKKGIKLAVFFIIFSTLFDISNVVIHQEFTDEWVDLHLLFKDAMVVGLSLGFFLKTKYRDLKLKTFTFMIFIYQSISFVMNINGIYNPNVILSLYAIYLLWLVRIQLINPKLCEYTGSDIQKNAVTYNIFIPVNTFRGLLKALFLFWTDPRYETTILVNKQIMYYVKNKMFHYEPKDADKIERFVQNTSARVNIKHLPPKKLKRINNLLYKRAITGVRDCRELEI